MLSTPEAPARSAHPRATAVVAAALVLLAGCGSQGGGNGDGTSAGEPQATPGQEAAGRGAAPGRPMPGSAWVVLGGDTVVAEVARTEEERAQGLMFRDEVPDGTGMLFVFPEESVRSFWMQDTYVDLDIAFIDTAFRIVDIEQMTARDTTSHRSDGPAMYALEVRRGWFAEHGWEVGETVEVVFGG